MWNLFKKKPKKTKFKVGDIIAMEYTRAEEWENKRSEPEQIIEISPTAYKTIDKYGSIGTVRMSYEHMYIKLVPVEPSVTPPPPPPARKPQPVKLRVIK